MTLIGDGARLVDTVSGRALGHAALRREVARIAEALSTLPEGVLFTRVSIGMPDLLRYLAAFESGRAVALIDPALNADSLASLIARFRPGAVLSAPCAEPPPGYRAEDGHWLRADPEGVAPHPELAILLATSGSTGAPQFARLSRRAILSNARAIAEVLGIGPDDVAPTSLPPHYSFGLSVLNSHLAQGATVVIEPSGILGRPFWDSVSSAGCTSLAAVPYHYEMLRRLDFDPARYPRLRKLTQAGGRLRPELVDEFDTKMRAAGGGLYVMYGQTEASPRMATMPAELLAHKPASVGPAVPGGQFSIRHGDGSETTHPKITGEVVYRGPNVMMGYAEDAAALALGDELGGLLPTGDLGYLDEDGFLFVTGRLKRIGKVFGNRVGLDDLEHAARATGLGIEIVAAIAADDKVVLFAEGVAKDVCKQASRALGERLHLHASGFDVRPIDVVPLLASGKIDYQALAELI
ncbi:AMP-binding protein [Amycolatopsis alkalitolerans]|uniref:AMP-binding protein n=1 Tax=Amycolatopsis alkalitolerans TaxID=2547244 RepID=A0A5C4M486_9PSEU|nr:AMP-binding protein [Amycolatopsis alkalitolerans]TNC27427.1 AMP-binding protein [Amycolatopsis alkalitolerans]